MFIIFYFFIFWNLILGVEKTSFSLLNRNEILPISVADTFVLFSATFSVWFLYNVKGLKVYGTHFHFKYD